MFAWFFRALNKHEMQLMLKYDNHFTWHRFRSIVLSYQRIYPDFNVDVEAELEKYVSILLFVYRFQFFERKTTNFIDFCANYHLRYKEYAEKLRPLVKDTISYLHNALKEGKSILVEGANAAMLDIDFGMYLKRIVVDVDFNC